MTYNYLSRANIEQRNRKLQDKWDNFDKLNPEEREAILKLYRVVETSLSSLREFDDLWISDLRELESAHWGVKHIWAIGDTLESLEDEDDEKI